MKQKNQSSVKPGKRWHLALLIPLAGLLAAALDCRLQVQRYTLPTPELSAPVRIALVSDLHACNYGRDQRNLLNTLHAQKPDLVLMTGDMFDDNGKNSKTEEFLAGIAGKYPSYYVTGNHEYYCEPEKLADAMDILERCQIPVLSGTWETVTVRGQRLNICGVDDPYAVPHDELIVYDSGRDIYPAPFLAQIEAVSRATENGEYTILLTHRPECFSRYTAFDFDLVLAGHAHGGQWRIPLLLNGLFSPNQGFFPQYAGGVYQQNGTVMVVSRGLARESTMIPRVFNRPELVIIDLVQE